jgi:hypothetical protein
LERRGQKFSFSARVRFGLLPEVATVDKLLGQLRHLGLDATGLRSLVLDGHRVRHDIDLGPGPQPSLVSHHVLQGYVWHEDVAELAV